MQHLRLIQSARVEDDAGGITTTGIVRKRGVVQNVRHARNRRQRHLLIMLLLQGLALLRQVEFARVLAHLGATLRARRERTA
jgi:hypothetical protein